MVPSHPQDQGLLHHRTEQQSFLQVQGDQGGQRGQEVRVNHLFHLGREDPGHLEVLSLLLDPQIDMMLGMKLLQAATESGYPQS